MNTKHGHWVGNKPSPTYNSWQKMKARCDIPTNNMYEYYGARGITYDPAWKEFKNFLADMGERPTNTSIDRINNNKNYSKQNCRWATNKQQAHNKNLYNKNTTGCHGIYQRESGNWRATIRIDGKLIHLGTTQTKEEAMQLRKIGEVAYNDYL